MMNEIGAANLILSQVQQLSDQSITITALRSYKIGIVECGMI